MKNSVSLSFLAPTVSTRSKRLEATEFLISKIAQEVSVAFPCERQCDSHQLHSSLYYKLYTAIVVAMAKLNYLTLHF